MEQIAICLLMLQKFTNLKQNISKDRSIDNVTKTGLTWYVYGFSVGCDAITVDDIKDVHKYLMKKK